MLTYLLHLYSCQNNFNTQIHWMYVPFSLLQITDRCGSFHVVTNAVAGADPGCSKPFSSPLFVDGIVIGAIAWLKRAINIELSQKHHGYIPPALQAFRTGRGIPCIHLPPQSTTTLLIS